MKKQFVTYEIALKLKKLGFNEISRFGQETSLYTKEGKHTFYANYGFMGSGLSGGYIYAPLWQQVIDWFRDKHNTNIEPIRFPNILKWGFVVTDMTIIPKQQTLRENINMSLKVTDVRRFDTFEESREQAILKAIELCKKQ